MWQSTPMTIIFWACSGKAFTMWTWLFWPAIGPFIFTVIADMVEWCLVHNHGFDFLQHCLDDFLTLGPPDSSVCFKNLHSCLQLCSDLGLPRHPDKLEGSSTWLTILSTEPDSVKLQARLPKDKHARIIIIITAAISYAFWKTKGVGVSNWPPTLRLQDCLSRSEPFFGGW